MRTRARAALREISEEEDVDVSGTESDGDDQAVERTYRTSHLLGNPAVVQKRMRRHRDDEMRRKPEIEVTPESEVEDEEEEESSESGGRIFGSNDQEREKPKRGFLDEEVDPHTEKVKYLTLLSKYSLRNDEVSRVIPNKRYGLDTPLSELKEVVQLCESILKEKHAAINKRFGVEHLNKFTSGLAGMMEAANVNLLDPDAQFPLDGLHDSISAKIEAGQFEEAHERMWEVLAPKLQFMQNPFVQWGTIFGLGVMQHGYNNKQAYEENLRPDPRKTRQRLKAAREKEVEGQFDDNDYSEEEDGNVDARMSEMGRSVHYAQGPPQPAGVMGRPHAVDFGSDSDEEPPMSMDTDTDMRGIGTGLPPPEPEVSGSSEVPVYAPIEVFQN